MIRVVMESSHSLITRVSRLKCLYTCVEEKYIE